MGSEHQGARDVAVLAVCLVACVLDLRRRRIPNWLTFGAAVAGILFNAFAGGFRGAGLSVAGWATGAALFLPWFLLRGMGAGDVKFVAAVGAWVGPVSALWVVVYAAIAGGVLAIFVSLAHGYLRKALSNVWWLIGYWRIAGLKPMPQLTLDEARGPRLAYALPIAAGTLVTLWLR